MNLNIVLQNIVWPQNNELENILNVENNENGENGADADVPGVAASAAPTIRSSLYVVLKKKCIILETITLSE